MSGGVVGPWRFQFGLSVKPQYECALIHRPFDTRTHTLFLLPNTEMVKKGFRKAATAKGVNGRQFFQQNKHLLEASDVGGGAGDDGDDIDEALFGEDVELPDDLDDDDADR